LKTGRDKSAGDLPGECSREAVTEILKISHDDIPLLEQGTYTPDMLQAGCQRIPPNEEAWSG